MGSRRCAVYSFVRLRWVPHTLFSAGDGVFATVGNGSIELVDLKSNSTTVLVKYTDIKDASIQKSWQGFITLTTAAGQGRHPLDFGLEDFFGHEAPSLENRPSQAVEAFEFWKLLDP